MYLQTRNTKTKQWLRPHFHFSSAPQPIAVRRSADALKKKKKFFLEKAQRYHRDIHSKKLPAKFEIHIVSRLREKCARRLRWRDPVLLLLL